jgi:tetratricopeptide (TPR) repeat protein
MALWNMASVAGRPSAFVAWWATWPAESVDGFMVTDRVSYSLFSGLKDSGTSHLTWPENYYSEIRSKLITADQVSDQDLAHFLHLTAAEISAERKKEYAQGKTNPVAYLAQVIASTRNYFTISQDLLSHHRFDLFSCYFEGIDQVGHLFQHYMPPKMEMVTGEEFRRYKDVVPLFYEYIDQLTGELLKFAGSDTVTILVSDHGFKNGTARPGDFPPYISDRPAYWHREYGMFVISGSPVRKNTELDTVTIFDVAPTVQYLLGLPVAEDQHGKALTDALQADFVKQFSLTSIASWEPLRTQIARAQSDSKMDSEMMQNLAALGYIGQSTSSPSVQGKETSAYHRNLAVIYLQDRNFPLAEQEITNSKAGGVVFETYDLLFQLRFAQGKQQEAAQALEEGFQRFANPPGEALLKLVDVYSALGETNQAEEAYTRYSPRIDSEKYRLLASGAVKNLKGDSAGAESDYLNALKLDPAFPAAMEHLYKLYLSHDELEKLEIPTRSALAQNDQLPLCHNVLGVLYKKRGNFQKAVEEYQKAIALDPDNSAYLTNLGAAYLSMQQPQKALDVLLRAKSKNGNDPEVWLNLGAIYGELQRNEEGLFAFERAKELGGESPKVYLGMAVIYAQKGDRDEARRIVESALQKYPGDPNLEELLAVLAR